MNDAQTHHEERELLQRIARELRSENSALVRLRFSSQNSAPVRLRLSSPRCERITFPPSSKYDVGSDIPGGGAA